MLKGKEFGAAIAAAIQRKIDLRLIKSQAEIARHFKVAPPSIHDWKKKGSISKDKLPELFRYFSDVAGYSHWGLTEEEWPFGLVGQENTRMASNEAGTLGQRLRSCRKENALTQHEVCSRTGIKQGTLSELENDKYPTSSYVPRLAALYGVEALWLAEGRPPKNINAARGNGQADLHSDDKSQKIFISPKSEIETIGKRLTRLREAKGITQAQLAKIAGVGQSTVAGIENESRIKTPGSLIEIAHALGVDAYYLKYGVETLVANDTAIHQVVDLMKKTAREGKSVVLDKAKDMRQQYPLEDYSKQPMSFQ